MALNTSHSTANSNSSSSSTSTITVVQHQHQSEDDYLEEEEEDEIKQVEQKVKKYTDRVRFWRVLVTVVLAATGIAVTTTTYLFLLDQEQANFEYAFGQFSRTVGDAAQREMLRLREAMRSFGETLEASTTSQNQSWPLYDYPDIEIFAQEQLDSKHMENLQYLTRVTHDQRQAWLDFESKIYERWVKAGHLRAYGNLDVLLQDGYQADILAVTAQGVVPSANKTEYWPLAYRYPPPNSYFVVGLDISSINYDDMFASLLTLKNQTLISNVNPYIESDEAESIYHAKFHSQLSNGSKADHPHSFMFHPVHAQPQNSDAPIVSMVLAPIAWDAALRNLMPDNVRGIIAVGRNNCNQNFTYLVSGKDAFFMGNADLHERQYDAKEYVVNLDFSDHPDFFATPGHCAYSLSIYPSSEFESAYASKTPLKFLILVGCTFCLMVGVFFTYDRVQQERNRHMVVDSARSNTIVSNMFPGALRDKVLLDQDKKREYYIQQRSNKHRRLSLHRHHNNTNNNAKNHQTGKPSMRDSNKYDRNNNDYADSILAELYPNATVLFADIKGFTQWSSDREPFQVFKLLETVFKSFDRKAKQMGVFKVETVGDCFVCVVGFPNAQEDHAIIMCSFAREILDLFQQEIQRLEPVLGSETLDLALRVGIHSGPVTAGVLRGERARVQLFGDTMNYASRMESNGKPWHIHASKECADQLIQGGLSNWVTARKELITVKGKGERQTYWILPKNTSIRNLYSSYDAVSEA